MKNSKNFEKTWKIEIKPLKKIQTTNSKFKKTKSEVKNQEKFLW